jgi:hypothetical protein
VLRKIFGSKREEVIESQRKVHNMEVHDLYSSLNIIMAIKVQRMKLIGHEK